MANILIVDDDHDIVEILSDVLKDVGNNVHTAHTGEEGLKVLRAASLPDAILLDVEMPVLGGPGMAYEMLLHDAGEERIPIILSSARGDLPSIAAEVGTPFWIAKPFEIEAFLALIDRALRERTAPAPNGDAIHAEG
jgi:CheY-like chemotaxis protein